jgi:hypothetical protein
MSRTSGDLADGCARLAVPPGWVEVDAPPGATLVASEQTITVSSWDDSRGVRPTMTASLVPTTGVSMASLVLEEAQAGLHDVHVVSIDPWPVPGGSSPGRRLAFAHTEGDTTLCTLVWVASTGAGEVIVTAHVDAMQLHRHHGAFAAAVAGISLPEEPGTVTSDAPGTAALARRAAAAPWAEVAPDGRGIRTAIVSDPDSRILVEASVGGTSLRFDATLARDRATIAATASPRAVVQRSPAARAASGSDLTTFRVPVTRLALAIAQWLGLAPAWTAATEPVTMPTSLLMNRLVDPTVPAPADVDATTWQQPWFLWTLRSSATDSGLVMVDAGTSGQCAVMETEDEHTARFAPLSSFDVWLTLAWLVQESVGG